MIAIIIYLVGVILFYILSKICIKRFDDWTTITKKIIIILSIFSWASLIVVIVYAPWIWVAYMLDTDENE